MNIKRMTIKNFKSIEEIGILEETYGFTQTLYHLRKGEKL